jgi:hypothetical protein
VLLVLADFLAVRTRAVRTPFSARSRRLMIFFGPLERLSWISFPRWFFLAQRHWLPQRRPLDFCSVPFDFFLVRTPATRFPVLSVKFLAGLDLCFFGDFVLPQVPRFSSHWNLGCQVLVPVSILPDLFLSPFSSNRWVLIRSGLAHLFSISLHGDFNVPLMLLTAATIKVPRLVFRGVTAGFRSVAVLVKPSFFSQLLC